MNILILIVLIVLIVLMFIMYYMMFRKNHQEIYKNNNSLADMLKYAIYFPQFHKIKENDVNFYPGYTDIINLRDLNIPNKETPSHKELYINSINDYDYVVNKNLIKNQIKLLHKYNIDGFATYHYWFSDNSITGNRMIMEEVNTTLLDSDLGGKKIFYIWANENWTKESLTNSNNTIIKNEYNDTEEHCKYLIKLFLHNNYLKIDNKPVFFIHHPRMMSESIFNNYNVLLDKLCVDNGFNGIYLILNSQYIDHKDIPSGMEDKYYDFHPEYKSLKDYSYSKDNSSATFINYKKYIDTVKLPPSGIQTIFFDFDNSARLYKTKTGRNPTICTHNTEEQFIKYFDKIKSNVPKILLINAWNEWGEKMHIEPSNEKGNYYLELIDKHLNLSKIPIVIISWNSLTLVRNFVDQVIKLPNNIIILDNNSSYPPLHQYYNIIEKKLKNRIKIIRLKENYGHQVYLKRQDLLPRLYILSDPDLELNPNMPKNVSNILYKLSRKYKKFKVGLSLDISDHEKFEDIKDYMRGKTILEWEKQFWKNKILDESYELYNAGIDTTFTLVNWDYYTKNNLLDDNIRIAGDFTCKHLPWYKNFYENNMPEIELVYLKKNNKSGTTLASKQGIKDNKFFV